MGRIKQGILGGFSGKVGPVVGSSWKGIAVLKSKPLSVANPRTAGQVAQRNSMTALVIVCQLYLAILIKPLWDRFAQQMSGYNAFVRANIACFVSGVFTNFSDFVISMGKLGDTQPISTACTASIKRCTINFINDSGTGFKLDSDLSYAAAYNETKGIWATQSIQSTRTTESASCEFAEPISIGDIIHAYLAFKRADGTIVSNSTYSTTITVA